jgi:hypothetical protein
MQSLLVVMMFSVDTPATYTPPRSYPMETEERCLQEAVAVKKASRGNDIVHAQCFDAARPTAFCYGDKKHNLCWTCTIQAGCVENAEGGKEPPREIEEKAER